jgi:hypothetical protein
MDDCHFDYITKVTQKNIGHQSPSLSLLLATYSQVAIFIKRKVLKKRDF